MRYTTILDITQDRQLYRNKNAVLLYLHLCLKAGYHDDDRDLLRISIRQMAYETGLTIAAVRHSSHVLQQRGLVAVEDGIMRVKKWLPNETFTKREGARSEDSDASLDGAEPKKSKRGDQPASGQTPAQEREAAQRQREEERARQREEEDQRRSRHTDSFIEYYESKMREAAGGDTEAAAIVAKNRSMYLHHCEKTGHEIKSL